MSSGEKNPPTLASLRSRRGRRSRTASSRQTPESESSLQTGFSFAAPGPAPLPESPPVPAEQFERTIWTVADLVARIRQHVESAYGSLWVEGEISNCRPATSGHLYFTLKDGESQLPVVLFRREAGLLRFRPADGLAVLVRGRVSIYESRGQLQFIAETMEPRGAGALQLAFEQLKARLLAEGLFDTTRKRRLPAFPRAVGVVTSPTGAVLRDIVTVVRRRHARLNLLVYPALVQGSSSPESVAKGVRWFNSHPGLVDIIVIARGGGSLEDLAGFNDESLARVIAASRLPIVSAVGHETDFTIADFVADLRAPTPSAAAEIITAAQYQIEDRLAALGLRLRRSVRHRLLLAEQSYARLSAEAVLVRLRDVIGRRQQHIDELDLRAEAAIDRRTRSTGHRLAVLAARLGRQNISLHLAATRHRLERIGDRLRRGVVERVERHGGRIGALAARLDALSPLSVLERGYALVYSSEGTLLRSAAETAPGETLHARLARGSLEARVTKTQLPDTQSTENSKS